MKVLHQSEQLIFAATTKEDGGYFLKREPDRKLTEPQIQSFLDTVSDKIFEETGCHRLSCAELVHGNGVRIVTRSADEFVRDADALVTKERDHVLVIRGSDCAPVLIHDQKASAFALVHAGRNPLRDRIIGEAANRLRALTRSKPDHTLAVIGPGICQSCYPVDKDVAYEFADRRYALEMRDGRQHLGLKTEIRAQLEGAQIPHIKDVNICTYEDSADWFSYRRRTDRSALPENHLFFAWMR